MNLLLQRPQKGGQHEENCSGPCGHECVDRHANAGANFGPIVIHQQPAKHEQYTAAESKQYTTAESKQAGAAVTGFDIEFHYARQ